MQPSKWLSHRMLLDVQEMQALLATLYPFSIYHVSKVIDPNAHSLSHDAFLSKYIEYIAPLKRGCLPLEKELKPYFSTAFSATADSFYAMEVKEGKWILRAHEPVIQLSLHQFTFSKDEEAFHSMVHSKEGVTWGLQFAFPQVYSNSIENDVVEVYKDSTFPNTQLFRKLTQWVRRQTTPARFKVEKGWIHATFRLGKECRTWIDRHPQLKSAGLST